jgi:peptide/nickel transport system ATP-binding protein/oligopeptide transport system ATP-binding protein
MCDRVAVMYLGTIVEVADNETLYSHPRHPYTGALLSAVPVADPHDVRSKKRQLLGGDVPSPSNPARRLPLPHPCPKARSGAGPRTPALERKDSGGMAACHFPLTDAEAAWQVPAGRRRLLAVLPRLVLVERLRPTSSPRRLHSFTSRVSLR